MTMVRLPLISTPHHELPAKWSHFHYRWLTLNSRINGSSGIVHAQGSNGGSKTNCHSCHLPKHAA
jgi:hypothetical protein